MTRRIIFAVLMLVPACWVSADTVELSGGGHLTGNVQRKENVVIVEVDDELQVAVRGSRVRRVVDSDQLQTYRAMAAKAGDDAEMHYQLAIWCVTDNNVPGDSQRYKDYHMRRAVWLDPEHIKARAALGFKKEQGAWVRQSDLMRDRGMISRAGRWALPEAAAIEDVEDAANVESKKWIREVSRLTKNALRKPNSQRDAVKVQDALESLRGINDPSAAQAIANQLNDSRKSGNQNRALRMLWVRLLGKFRNTASVRALVQAGIEETDETIREAALDQLVEYGAGSAVATYLQMLKPPADNRLINRAARALSWFPDKELALTYVDALVTEHKKVVAPGAGMQAGFDKTNGGGGMSMGGKAQVKKYYLENPSVLTLLKMIEPDAPYGFDQNAWRNHFAMQRTTFTGDLRRDP